jgi:hypothetical protein
LSPPAATPAEAQRSRLAALVERAGVSLQQLWLDYFALGGGTGEIEVEAFLAGIMPLPAVERDLLAQALNERLDQTGGRDRAPYSRTIRHPLPATGPLAALVSVLDGAQAAPPERLADLAERAGELLGVQIVIYLSDYQQQELLALSEHHDRPRESLAIDATLAGRAFRAVETVAVDGATSRMWLPLVDGTERLGVIQVTVVDSEDLADPFLREQTRWLASLLGHLVTITGEYGDAIDSVRRRAQRTAAAELVWALLPPLTAATDTCTISGVVEPSYTVGGDTFDYALSEHTATFAIFDAMGHGLTAGLLSAAALGAYRAARRNGADLMGQAAAIDDAVAAQTAAEGFVTGILAELDLGSGQLHYLAAGHPLPLLIRAGRVSQLDGGRRLPFGLEGLVQPSPTLGDTVLHPQDWLALHTDGIVEARDTNGNLFGNDRLYEFLERQAATPDPAPEALRRLVRAVLAHQHDTLQDDATILITHWHPTTPAPVIPG